MLPAGMRVQRAPRLPDPVRMARVAPHAFSANQGADTGAALLRLQRRRCLDGRMQGCSLCAAFELNVSEVATCCRDPEQSALSLRVSAERMLTQRLSCSLLHSHGSVSFGSAASAWRFQSPNLFSLSSPKCSGRIVVCI